MQQWREDQAAAAASLDTAGLFAAHNQAAGNVLCTVMSISTPYQYMILLEFTIFEIVFSFVS